MVILRVYVFYKKKMKKTICTVQLPSASNTFNLNEINKDKTLAVDSYVTLSRNVNCVLYNCLKLRHVL